MKRGVVVLVVLSLVVLSIGWVGFLLVDRAPQDTIGVDTPELDPVAPTASGQPASEAPDPALDSYYGQQPEWKDCGSSECATIEVPLNYADPSETIELNLLRVPAEDQEHKIGSLVVNPGGPGAPGTTYAAQASFVFRDPLLKYFDIVGFDPRGTGESAPVDCFSDEELDAYVAEDPEPDTSDEVAAFVDNAQAFGAGCVAKSGDLAGHVSTIEAARDMDVLRSALGESQLSYFGASYGTKLGATYAELFPDRVGRFVLDGAVDISLTSRDSSLQQAAGFETALRAYVDNCVETTQSCFLGDSVDEGLAKIGDFLDQVDEQPLPTDGDRDLELGNAFYGIVTPLYNREYWMLLSNALRSGFDGDGSALLELSDIYASRNPAGGYTDNSMEAFLAISCLDDSWSIDPAEVEEQYPDFEAASPTFGKVFAWGLVGCSGQQAESTEKPLKVTGAGAAPIVVVGTTRDPATPMAWAEALAAQLESGVLIRRDGDGHTGYNAGNECVDLAVESYLVEAVVPDDGLSC